jgi:hypothetical protein
MRKKGKTKANGLIFKLIVFFSKGNINLFFCVVVVVLKILEQQQKEQTQIQSNFAITYSLIH